MTRQRALLAIILLGGAALRFWALGFGLPFPEARPDETTIVITSTGLLYGGMNPHFFHWPSLMFYVVAAVYRIGWEIGHLQGHFVLKFDMFKDAAVHAAPYIMVARVIAAASGTLTIWLVYKLALRLFDRLTAITAAFFVAVAFLHVRDSHFGVTDVPMTALVVAAMLPLATLLGDPSRMKTWMFAGALAGLAASTKYNGGVVAASGVAIAMVHLAGGDAAARRAAARGLAAYGGAALIAFLAGTPYALLDWPHFIEGLRFDASHLMEGHGVVLGPGWRYHLTFSLWYGMGAPLLFAALAGLAVVWRSWRKAILLCSFPLLYFFVVGRGYTVFVRYITPVVPFLCLAAAIFVVELTRRIVAPARLPGAVAAIAVLIVWPSLVRDWRFDRLMGQTDTRVLATDWVNAHVKPGEWLYQAPAAFLYPDFGAPKPANLAAFDSARGAFVDPAGAVVQPAWIAIAESPLTSYTALPGGLRDAVAGNYMPAEAFAPSRDIEPGSWFDQQDLFFAPYVDFSLRERPGPAIQILQRK